MKKLMLPLCGLALAALLVSFTETPLSFDLHKLAKKKGIEVFNRKLTFIDEPGRSGIRLSKDEGEGIAWLKGVDFKNGIIEFDVRGEDVKQHSFVGIAFHGVDNATFDAIYLRPFNFRAQDATARSHGIQYISLPEFPWRTLRENSPNKYENSIEPAPDPNSWIRFRLVVEQSKVSVYLNGGKEPSLVVDKVTKVSSGAVGFYVADTSGGDFANITITKID